MHADIGYGRPPVYAYRPVFGISFYKVFSSYLCNTCKLSTCVVVILALKNMALNPLNPSCPLNLERPKSIMYDLSYYNPES